MGGLGDVLCPRMELRMLQEIFNHRARRRGKKSRLNRKKERAFEKEEGSAESEKNQGVKVKRHRSRRKWWGRGDL